MNHPAMRAAHFTTSDTVIPPILRYGWGSSAGSHCVRRLRIVDGAGIALPQHDVGLQDLLRGRRGGLYRERRRSPRREK